MSQSLDTKNGTTFLFNPGLDGNVTILRGNTELTLAGSDLMELAKEIFDHLDISPDNPITH